MPDLIAEMTATPVGQIVSSTMDALIEGQYAASLKSLELFEEVAYDDNGNLNTMSFQFHRVNPDYDPNNPGDQPTISSNVEVPTAMLVNYANMSIDHADIDFNVELSSTEYSKTSTSLAASAAMDFRARLGWWGNLRISGKVAHQKKTLSGMDVKRNYGLNVKAHIVRENPPPALEKVFGLMLEGLVQ